MKKNLLVCFLFLITLQLHAEDYYWVGGTGSWTDVNHWATTSGGSIKRSQVPTVNDDVYFDGNSGLLNTSIVDFPPGNAYCRNMSWEGVTTTPAFRNNSSFTLFIAGNLELAPTVKYGMQRMEFTGSGNATYKMNGAARINSSGWYNPFVVNKIGGSLTLLDGIPAELAVTTVALSNGHFNMSNHQHTFASLSGNGANVRSLDITNAEIKLTSTWDFRGANSSLVSDGSYINTEQFHSDRHHFPKVDINRLNSSDMVIGGTSFGELTFTSTQGTPDALRIGGNNTIDRLEFKSNGILRAGGNTIGELIVAPGFGLQVFGTNTITKLLRLNTPDCSGLGTLSATNSGTLNFSPGAITDLRNVYIKNIEATGGITLPIDVIGADGEGNSGWTFQVPSVGTTLYWVGGAGDWNDMGHWSATSGGTGGYCVPFLADDVVFDENSGFTASSNTVATSGNTWCHNMTWGNVGNAPILKKDPYYKMEVHGSLVMNRTVTMNAEIDFKGDQAATLTTNGSDLGLFRMNVQKIGPEGGITLLDDFNNPSAYIALYSGKCLLSGRTLNIGTFASSSGNRTIDITNATFTLDSWTLTGVDRTWIGNAAGSFITANKYFIASGLEYPKVHSGTDLGSNNINTVTIGELILTNPSPTSLVSAGTNNTIGTLEFKGAGYMGANNTINNLLLAPSKKYFFTGANTINGLFQFNSPSCDGLGEIRGVNGIAATLNFGPSSSLDVSSVYVQDMIATGKGIPVTLSGADAGGNTGFNITSSAGGDRYWVGGSGDWNDSGHWSLTSGGLGGACVPTVDTDVYFDGASFVSGGNEVTVSNGNAYCRNMDWTGATNNPVFTKNPLFDMEIWGNLVMNPLARMNTNVRLLFVGPSDVTITTNGSNLGDFDFKIKKATGTAIVKVLDDMSNPLTRIELERGGLDLRDRIVNIEAISDLSTAFPTSINISNAKLDLQWDYRGSQKSLTASGSDIKASYFASNGGVYNKVDVTTASSSWIGILNTTFSELLYSNSSPTSGAHISGGNTIDRLEFKGRATINGTGNTIGTLIFSPGKVYTLLAGSNNTITGDWFGSGTPCNLTEIVSSSTTVNATITKTTGGADFDYIRLRRITAVSPIPLVAHEHSFDQGNNINWDIATYNGSLPIAGLGPDLALNLSQFPYTLNTDGFFGSPLSQYVWRKDGNVIGTGDQLIITEPGTYKVDVTFPDGCAVSDEIIVSRGVVDLSIVKTVDEPEPDVGSNVVFKLLVTNEGPGEGTDIRVEDLLPAGYSYVSSTPEAGTSYNPATGIWTIGTLAAAAKSTLNITATVNPTGPYSNTATVMGAEVDLVPENNNSTNTPIPVPIADLSVVKTIDDLNPYAGNNVVFSIEVNNIGPSDATAVQVNDLLPSGYAFISAIPSVGTYDSGTGVWTVGNLANGGNATLQITATVKGTGIYANSAEVSGNEADRILGNNSSTSTPAPIIVQINKVGPEKASAGTEITYVLSVTNTGTGNATDQVIEDIIPDLTNVTWVATNLGAATLSNGANGTGNNVQVTGDIPAGGANQITITITGTIPASPSVNSLSNIATATAPGSPGFSSNTVITTITKQSDLHIQKIGPPTVVAGSEVAYTLEITNAGPSDAKNVTITDLVPDGLNAVTWTASAEGGATVDNTNGTDNVNLLVGIPFGTGKVLVTISGTLDADYVGATIENTATAVPEPGVIDPTTATSTVISTVSRVANIRITKSGPANIGAGEDISYTLRVVNDGPSNAAGVEIKDVLPTEIENSSWTSIVQGGSSINGSTTGNGNIDLTGDLPSGGVIEIAIKGKVASGAQDGDIFANTATANLPAGSSVLDPDLTSNTSSVATLVSNAADFTVSKSGPATVNIGDPIHYSIVIRNGGLADITGAAIEDIVPDEVTVTSWDIVGTGGATVTGSANGNTNMISSTGDILADGDPLTALTLNVFGTVNGTALLSINHEFTNKVEVSAGNDKFSEVTTAVNTSTDVSIEKSGPQSVTAGSPISYTLKVSNAGPIDAADLVIEDLVPGEVENMSWIASQVGSAVLTNGAIAGDVYHSNPINITADIPSGAGNHILITINGIVSSTTALTEITNTAKVMMPAGGTITDFNLANNTSTVETIITKETDLAITKTVNLHTPMVGSNVDFTLVATNKGPSSATEIEVSDLLATGYTFVSSAPAASYDGVTGTWTIGTLASGASETLTITARVNATGPYENSATIEGAEIDPDPTNNSATVITFPIPQAHLTTVKELKDGAQLDFVPGDAVLYTITVENNGPSDAENVNIKDIAPLGTQISAWTAITSAGVNYPNASGTGNLNETLAVLANGSSAIYEVEVKTPSNFIGSLSNTAIVSSTTKDPTPGACADCTTDPLPSVGAADLVTIKSLKDPSQTTFVPGEEVVYTITVTNNGPSDAQVVNIKDSAPAGTVISSWTGKVDAGTFMLPNPSGTGNLNESIAIFPNAAVVTYEVTVKTQSDFIGDLVNTVLVTSITDDPDPICADCITAPITAVPSADLVTVKTTTDVTQASFVPGETVVYSIRIMNNGPSDAQDVNIKDTAPAGTVISGWTAKVILGTVSLPNTSGAGNLDETIARLPNGAVISYEIMVQTPASFTGTLSNSADVTSGTDDPSPGCSTCTTSPLVAEASADLLTVKTTKDLTQTSFVPGEEVVYIITVSNNGPSDAQQVNIKDIAPIGTTVIGWTAAIKVGTFSLPKISGIGNLDETIVTLPNGAAVDYEVRVKTQSDFIGDLVNTVLVTSSTDDPDPTCADCETAPIAATPAADLVTVKTTKDLNQTAFAPGEEVVYTIVVTNNGPSDAELVNIQDAAPSGTTISSWNATVNSGTVTLPNAGGTGNLDETIAVLPNGATVVYEVFVKAPADFVGYLSNTAVVTSGTDDPDPICTDCETTPIPSVASADLVTVKTTTDITQASFIPGEEVVYTITVTNDGPSDAELVNIQDTAPSGTTISSWKATVTSGAVTLSNAVGTGNLDETIAMLPNGAIVSYEVIVKTPADFVGNLSNASIVTSATDDPDPICLTCETVAIPAAPIADLVTVKTTKDLAQTAFVPGEEVVYTITVTNNGPSDAQFVNIQDTAPSGTMISRWNAMVTLGTVALPNTSGTGSLDEILATLPNGTIVSYEVIVKTPADFVGNLINTAIVTSNTDDPNPACTACVTVPLTPVPTPDVSSQLELWKTGTYYDLNADGKVNIGDVVNYSFIVRNTGNDPIDDIRIYDAIVSVNGEAISLAAGEADQTTFSAVYAITQADIDKGSVYNLARATGRSLIGHAVTVNSKDPNPLDPNDPATITLLTASSQVILVKTVMNTGTGGNGAFLLGDEIQYQFVVTNTGNTSLSDMILNDPLISSIPVILPGNLMPGVSVTHTESYVVTLEDVAIGQVLNQANLTAKDPKGTILKAISGTAPGNTNPTLTLVSDVPPRAENDHAETESGKSVQIPVLDNDQGGSSRIDPSTIELVRQPLHGVVNIQVDGTISYTSDEGYAGDDVFTYRVKDVNGNWSNEAIVTITIIANELFIPNVFSPNGDGNNDTFEIVGLEGFDNGHLTIFNRWGSEVYRNPNYKNNWDGSNLNEGTYYYLITLTKEGKESVHKGWVLLKR